MMTNQIFSVGLAQYVAMFLKTKSVEDADFKKKYENPDKNLDSCLGFIYRKMADEAIKRNKESKSEMEVITAPDADVLSLAVQYYTDDDLVVTGEKLSDMKIFSASATTFSDEEKAQMRQNAIKKYQDDVIAEQKKKDEERRNKLKAKTKKATTPVLVPDVPQNGNVETPTPQAAPKAECVQMDLFK